MAKALLDRETIDAAEIKLIINGDDLPPMKSPLAQAESGGTETQKVLKPEAGRAPGFGDSRPSPA